jgi:hypothetical protein
MKEQNSAIAEQAIAVSPQEGPMKNRITLWDRIRMIGSDIQRGQDALFHQPWNR